MFSRPSCWCRCGGAASPSPTCTQLHATAFLVVAALAVSAAASNCPYSCDYEASSEGCNEYYYQQKAAGCKEECESFQTCFVSKSSVSDSDYCGPALGNCDKHDAPGSFVTFFRNQKNECWEALCEHKGEDNVACCDEYERIK